jgi:NodT family efflux transporter outer membrane factor (OMF) lipoprotein
MCTSANDRRHRNGPPVAALQVLAVTLMASGCLVGPKYVRPPVPTPPAYKELSAPESDESQTWRPATPNDGASRGKWWLVFNDPQLNGLEEKASASNWQIVAAADNFLAARALVHQARSQYFPTLSTNPGATRSLPSSAQFGGLQAGKSAPAGLSLHTYNDFSLPFDASWEPDFWGRIRNGVRANLYGAQASAADLQNVRLSIQAELAVDYYQLRAQDSLKLLLDSTVATYQACLELTRAQYQAGLGTDEAVAQAETQLETAQVEDTNLEILRDQYEHAIAVLIGQPASSFLLRAGALDGDPPEVPVGIPSELLERRPDVASAERSMAQANAQIGLAKTAFFPSMLLSASGGFGSSSISNWLTRSGGFWSAGPALAETIFDAGLRRATVQQFRAAYDETVANYEQTVLTAFQQVEDNLASLRVLRRAIDQQKAATEAARRTLEEATARYKAGVDPYLNVTAAQTALLNHEQTLVTFREERMLATVQLIKALGGGWNAAGLPTEKEIRTGAANRALQMVRQ